MKRIIGILTLSCLLFSACGKDEIPQEENEKKTEETTVGDDTGGDKSDDDPDSPKLVVSLHVEGRYLKMNKGKLSTCMDLRRPIVPILITTHGVIMM